MRAPIDASREPYVDLIVIKAAIAEMIMLHNIQSVSGN